MNTKEGYKVETYGDCSVREGVSWLNAYQDGLNLAIHHWVFIPLVAFATICERSVSFYTVFTGITVAELARQYVAFLTEITTNYTGELISFKPYSALLLFMPIAIFLFCLGAIVYIGVLGLMRDLLIHRGFAIQHLGKHGLGYFWPILRYKLPIYSGLSCLFLLIFPLLSEARDLQPTRVLIALPACFIFGAVALWGRIMLSMGPKAIVVRGNAPLVTLYGDVYRLVRPWLFQVLIFYIMMLICGAVAVLVPVFLSWVGLPESPVMALGIFLLAFYGVFLRAASFHFYLQLLQYNNTIKGSMVYG